MKKYLMLIICGSLLSACGENKTESDASGTFEAVETIVSAEAAGSIKMLNLEEGVTLRAGEMVGTIDSVQLYLKKKQLLAQKSSVLSGRPDADVQIAAILEQLRQAEREQQRLANLVKADAATQKQLDDATSQVSVIKKQIGALKSSLAIITTNLNEQAVPLDVQISQLNDQLAKSRIINPVAGTVLTKYAEVGEVTQPGKPVYKIAALSTINLRVYLTGTQLPQVKVGQPVNVLVDDIGEAFKTYKGTIEWISAKAEFTPKTIQTKDERANLVYAIKIKVQNDGYLKIGMYGEVKL
jgi:HlyD family secretion protein